MAVVQPLPTPDELPTADVVIFDGKCVFCSQQVRNLLWFDGGQRLAFISLHDPRVAQRFPDLSVAQLMQQMFVIPHGSQDPSAPRLGGAYAIRYLTRRLPRLWVFAPLLHIPFAMPVWQALYRQVAKRRYRIANRNGDACDPDGTCKLHE